MENHSGHSPTEEARYGPGNVMLHASKQFILSFKLVERALLAQINSHCNTNNLLHDYQSAYRENRSCETVLLKLVNDLLWAMERKNVIALIALDLSATFDMVDHGILLSTLNHNLA